MKILVDSDWILELFVNREQYRTEAEKLLHLLQNKMQVEVYATELCLDKIRSFLGQNDPQLGYDGSTFRSRTDLSPTESHITAILCQETRQDHSTLH